MSEFEKDNQNKFSQPNNNYSSNNFNNSSFSNYTKDKSGNHFENSKTDIVKVADSFRKAFVKSRLKDAEDLSLPVAYLLLIPSFMGFSGLHRFYMGKIGTGILWFLTVGLFGFGTLYDLITLGKQIKDIKTAARLEDLLLNKQQKDNFNTFKSNSANNIEKVVFKTAMENDGIINIPKLVINSNFSTDQIKEYLKNMESKGFISSNVTKNGDMVYTVSEFLTDEKRKELEF